MTQEEAKTQICEECALSHDVTPATHKLKWDLGSCWLCEKCYNSLIGVSQ